MSSGLYCRLLGPNWPAFRHRNADIIVASGDVTTRTAREHGSWFGRASEQPLSLNTHRNVQRYGCVLFLQVLFLKGITKNLVVDASQMAGDFFYKYNRDVVDSCNPFHTSNALPGWHYHKRTSVEMSPWTLISIRRFLRHLRPFLGPRFFKAIPLYYMTSIMSLPMRRFH